MIFTQNQYKTDDNCFRLAFTCTFTLLTTYKRFSCEKMGLKKTNVPWTFCFPACSHGAGAHRPHIPKWRTLIYPGIICLHKYKFKTNGGITETGCRFQYQFRLLELTNPFITIIIYKAVYIDEKKQPFLLADFVCTYCTQESLHVQKLAT